MSKKNGGQAQNKKAPLLSARREAIPKTDLSINLKTVLVNHIQSNRLIYSCCIKQLLFIGLLLSEAWLEGYIFPSKFYSLNTALQNDCYIKESKDANKKTFRSALKPSPLPAMAGRGSLWKMPEALGLKK